MSILQIVFSADFLIALLVYGIAIILALPCFDKIHKALAHSMLQWPWEHIGMPLLRSALMLLFILLAYPIIFALTDAPSFSELLDGNERKVNYLINLIFLTTLLFPLVPVLGDWEELVLPAQAIAACSLLFSWLSAELEIDHILYWTGFDIVLYIVILAFITHWIASALSHHLGVYIDEKYNVHGAGELLTRALVLFMQSPAILLYSAALGRQLS